MSQNAKKNKQLPPSILMFELQSQLAKLVFLLLMLYMQLEMEWQAQLPNTLALLLVSTLVLLRVSKILLGSRMLLSKHDYDGLGNPSIFAVELPLITCWLDQEIQAELIEMRELWYGDRPLNFRTHFSVELRTLQYLIYDHLWFWLRQKFLDRFQPMKRERLPRINHSD